MKKQLRFLLGLLVLSTSTFAQQQLNLLGLTHSMDHQSINPAYIGNTAFEICLFPLASNIYSNGPSYQDFIGNQDATNVLRFPSNKVEFGQNNLLRASSNIETFRIRYSKDNWSLALHHAARTNGIVEYSGALLAVAIRGNAPFIGQNLALDTDFTLFSYEELGVNLSFQFDKLKIGGRFKYLSGHSAIITRQSAVNLLTDEEIYELTLDMDFHIDVAGQEGNRLSEFNFGPIGLNFTENEDLLVQSPELLFNLDDDLFNFSGNHGLAFDLGAEWQINEAWQLNLSILDIGKVNWKDNPRNYIAQEVFEFDGLNLGQLTFDGTETIAFETTKDSLDIIEFNRTESSFSTKLPAQFLLGLGCQVNPKWRLHSTLYYSSFQNQSFTALSLSANYQLFPTFNLGINYSLMNEQSLLLGLNAHLKAGPVQIFMMTDNILGVFDTANQQTLNARVGVGFTFGKKENITDYDTVRSSE